MCLFDPNLLNSSLAFMCDDYECVSVCVHGSYPQLNDNETGPQLTVRLPAAYGPFPDDARSQQVWRLKHLKRRDLHMTPGLGHFGVN